MADVLRLALEWTGPADVSIATWSIGKENIIELGNWLADGSIIELRLLLDRSLASRHPKYARLVEKRIGEEKFRAGRVHAKWCVCRGRRRSVVVRGSGNLNRNPRVEVLDLDCDNKLAVFFADATRHIFEAINPGWPTSTEAHTAESDYTSHGLDGRKYEASELVDLSTMDAFAFWRTGE